MQRKSKKNLRKNVRNLRIGKMYPALPELLEPRRLLSAVTVNTTSDMDSPNTVTLRDAITAANNPANGIDTINFALPSGSNTIALASPLPVIVDPGLTIVGLDATSQTRVQLDGSSALPAQGEFTVDGLTIDAANVVVKNLSIGGFSGSGVVLENGGNDTLSGDYIGVDSTGVNEVTNTTGVSVLGGQNTLSGNVISGNENAGVDVFGSGNTLAGNSIGIDAEGGALGNGIGVEILGTQTTDQATAVTTTVESTNNTLADNVISGNFGQAVSLELASFNTIKGNFVGTDENGDAGDDYGNGGIGILLETGAHDNMIGGPGSTDANVIADNGEGVKFATGQGTSNVLEGNQIGLDATGALDGNLAGVRVTDGVAVITNNVIAGNFSDGISLESDYSVVTGNWIGTDTTGLAQLGNSGSGIIVTGSNNQIGGAGSGQGNIIAFNGSDGVFVRLGQGNAIRGNSIYSNTVLGIALGNDSEVDQFGNPVTDQNGNPIPQPLLNDSMGHAGQANLFQDFPVITSITGTSGNPTVSGTLQVDPSTPAGTPFTIDFFTNSSADPTGYGQGQTYVGSTTATANGTSLAPFSFSTTSAPAGQSVWSSTATDPQGNTSEFSLDQEAPQGGPAVSTTTLVPMPDPSVFGQSVTLTANVTGTAALTGQVQFMDGSNLLGTVTPDSNGNAVLTTGALIVGSHAITADYINDTTNAPSSASATQVVIAADTTTSLAVAANPSTVDLPVILTATVAVQAPGSGSPSGTVNFLDGGVSLGSGSLALVQGQWVATLSVSGLVVGDHSLTAVYSGDGSFNSSTSAPVDETILPAETSTSLSSSADPSAFGQSVTFTATVTSDPVHGGLDGSVTFADGSTVLGTVPLMNGMAQFTASGLPLGSDSITANYASPTKFAPSSTTLTQIVDPAATAVTLSSSMNPSVYGQSVTLTAAVGVLAPGAGSPTGTVTFTDGMVTLGTVALSNGVATVQLTLPTVGDHPITAQYSGDTDDQSSSASLTQTVNAASTTTSIASSANPSVFGQTVTFTARVAANLPGSGIPDGVVTFFDGATDLGTVTLSNGVATISTADLAVGGHAITAEYTGDASFSASSSPNLPETVNADATSTGVTAFMNPSSYGQTVLFTATVTAAAPGAGTPTGTILFTEGSTDLGSAPLVNGVATFIPINNLDPGDNMITAAYSGDANFLASSGGVTEHVDPAPTSTAIVSSANPTVYGQSTNFTVTVTSPAGTPGGTVMLFDGSNQIGSAALVGGAASFSSAVLSVNSHNITAVYGGANDFFSSTASLVQNVAQDSSSTAVVSSADPSVYGQNVVLTATVTANAPGAGTPTGTVIFEDGSVVIGSGILSAGTATYTAMNLSVASHSITAIYQGDLDFIPSQGGDVQAVNQDPTSTGIVSSLNPSKYGETVTFTAAVSPDAPGAGMPGGTVTFYEDSNPVGTGIVDSSGHATYTTATLSTLQHTIVAQYGGDTNFLSSASAPLLQLVNQQQTGLTLSSSANPSVFGQPVSFTAAISLVNPDGSVQGTPSGTITFFDGNTLLGAATVNSNGSATLTTGNLAVASHPITAVYGGSADGNFVGASSSILTQVVNPDATQSSVVSSVNPSVYGQSVTFTATVSSAAPGSGTPTGLVNFLDGGSVIGTATLGTAGTATFTTSSLAVASHPITVAYVGSSNYMASTSAPLTQIVNKDGVNATIVSSANPSVTGQTVTFTATIAAAAPGAGTPTGTVTFFDGATSLGSATLAGGVATLATANLSGGSHTVSVSYGGDTNFATGTASITQQVNAAGTQTTVSSSAPTTVYGQSVTFTATVTPAAPGSGVPTGTVTFFDGSTALGTSTLSGSAATLTLTTLAPASHSIKAVYNGSTSFLTSTSAPITQTVNKDAVGVALTSSINPSTLGQTVTFTATVSAAAPGAGTATGTVTFKDGSTTLGTGTLSGGIATFSTAGLAIGSHSITAVYGGDANFSTGTSGALTQNVLALSTSTAISSSANPSTLGQSVTLTATVSAASGTPAGTITFKDGTTTLGTATLSNGVATFATTTLAIGTHAITAVYSGNTSYNPSTSPNLNQVVNPAASSTAVTSSVNPSSYGQAVTLTAKVTVAAGLPAPTGTITFKDGTTVIGTGTISAGQATLTISTLTAGAHPITAVYGGDSNFVASTSPSITQTVAKDATTTAVVASANPSKFGQSVTFTATVTAQSPGAGTPTGQIQFLANGVVIGTGAISGGHATFTTSTLGVGIYTITANYLGDANFLTSSGAMSFTVNQPTPGSGIILLDSSARGSLTDTGNGSLVVNGTVTVDSSNSAAISITGNGTLKASEFDVVGGTSKTGNAKIVGTVKTGSAPVADPLAALAVPDPSTLTARSASRLQITGNQSVTLNPGVYVGGISITGQGHVTLNPGIYYLKGGGLAVTGQATVTDLGKGVLIYNAAQCNSDTISLTGNGAVNLSPMTSGPWMGITLFQDRKSAAPISITGNGSTVITGTFYAAAAAVYLTGNGGFDSSGDPLDTLGTLWIADDLIITGNGDVAIGTN